MPRRKKRWWKPHLKTNSTQSIFALILILLGVLTAISYLAQAAEFSNLMQTFLNRFFGFGAILIPPLLLLAGLSLTKLRWEVARPRVFWGSSLLTASLLGLAGVVDGESVGLLGRNLADLTSRLISPFGAGILFLTGFIIALLIILNASLDELVVGIVGITQPIWEFMEKHVFHRSLEWWREQRQGNQESRITNQEEDSKAETQEQKKKYAVEPEKDTGPEIEVVSDDSYSEPSVPSTPSSLSKNHSAPPYEFPPLSLLADQPEKDSAKRGDIEENAKLIEKTLQDFGIEATVAEVNLGPSVTQYAVDLAEGVRANKITNLQSDIALSLASPTGSVRVEAPIPGKRLIGIEVPNHSPTLVALKSILTSSEMKAMDSKLGVALGLDVAGKPVVADAARWPHMLIAGTTGGGKSVLIHSLLTSILFRARPDEVNFILVDPKRVELTQYDGIPHLRTPVIVDAEKTISAFKWAIAEMEKRYKLFQQVGSRDIRGFNQTTDTEKLPYIMIIVDELADLMAFAANEMEMLITRIAQMARATGIHMILSTQRPSVDVITGLIKANIPGRIALNVSSGTDSRVIIDGTGSEKLLGKGDMLYLPPDKGRPQRVQGALVSDKELRGVIKHLEKFNEDYNQKEKRLSARAVESGGQVAEDFEEPEDDRFDEAVKVIVNHDKASASLLQRRLSVGYARAARLLDELEERGMVSEKDGSKPRDVYVGAVRGYLKRSGQDGEDLFD